MNPKRIRAFGITNETKAWRFGSIDRRRSHFKPDQINFSTELDGLNSTYLSSPALVDDIILTAQTGRITAVDESSGVAAVVTTDIALEYTDGVYYWLAFAKPDGTMSSLYAASPVSPTLWALSGLLDFTPVFDGTAEAPLFTFGPTDEWATHVIVRDIQPQGDDTVQLICEEHIAEIWADIDNAPS